MTDAERQALTDQLVTLRLKLVKRQDQPGFAANCADIAARIGELETQLSTGNQTV